LTPITLWLRDSAGDTQEAVREVKGILENEKFDSPKPMRLIKRILELATEKDSIILDSFAGSGTTAHAVLDLNQEDGGTRRFILVECLDYADNITAERVRRVIKGVPGAKDENLQRGLGGSFSYFEIGEPIEFESILQGDKLPSYMNLARYVFYTATGEEFLPDKVNEDKHFIGESKEYEVYLFYKPDLTYLKSTALTLEIAKGLGEYTGKKKLVFAPTKYLDLNDSELLAKHGLKGIEYCQLPFEIYRLRE
jgi:adenine-specific DNA-methyltransferase